MIGNFKKAVAASAIALALALPAYSQASKPEQLQRTAFEKQIEKIRPNEAFFLMPQLGWFGQGSVNLVVSVQTVTVTINAGATTGTQSLSPSVAWTSATNATASIHYGGSLGPHTTCNSATDTAGVEITANNQVTATRNTSDATNALTVVCTVIDWNPAKIQYIEAGKTTMTAANSNTSTLGTTLTSAARAAIVLNGTTTTNTGNAPTINKAGCTLTNTTTVTVNRNTGTNNLTVYWTVIEWKTGVLAANTQSRTITAASGSSGNDTITAVANTALTVLFWGGHKQNHGSYDPDHEPYIQLTSTTNVAWTRGGSGGTSGIDIYYHVVEFAAADIATIQRGTIVIATSSASNTYTVSPTVTVTKAFANYNGKTNSNAASNGINVCDVTLALTASNQATATRSTADASSTATVGYEIVGFT